MFHQVIMHINNAGSRFTISASNPTLNKQAAGGGSMKIANDIIEEVDEQQTITSMGKRPEARRVYLPNYLSFYFISTVYKHLIRYLLLT